jgi:DNA polymerase-1
LSFDYSQVELRIASHLAGEEKMQEAFLKGKDIHVQTASTVFGVQESQVTPEMRFRAKALNFGIIYGMGARGFSRSAGIPFEEAQDFIENYFVQCQHIKQYMEDTIAFAKEHGYVETLFGRKRYIPDINSTTPQIRSAAEREAINHPIQGTQADIIKMAMVRISPALTANSDTSSAIGTKLLLQIHDELLFEISDDIIEETAKRIKGIMENVYKLSVALRVDVSTGRSWGGLDVIKEFE